MKSQQDGTRPEPQFEAEPDSQLREEKSKELDSALTPVLEQHVPAAERAQILRRLKDKFGADLVEAQLIERQVIKMEITERQQYSGPLPPPDLITAYPPPVQEAIVQMAVKAQDHAHTMQKMGLEATIAKDRRGQYLAFTIAAFALIVAAIVAKYSPAVAGIIAGIDLVALSAVFLGPRVIEANNKGKSGTPKKPKTVEEKEE